MTGYSRYSTEPVAKKVESIYLNRLPIFLSKGQYKDHNLTKFYDLDRTDSEDHIKISVWSPDGLTRPPFKDAVSNSFRPAKKGDKFGPAWTTHWFKLEIESPWSGVSKDPIILHWDCENEGMVYTEKGEVVVGLSGEERREVRLAGSGPYTLFIETSCNGMFGNGDPHDNIQPPDNHRYFTLQHADLVRPNWEARALAMDFSVIADCANNLNENGWQKHRALEIASEIMDRFDEFDESSIVECRKIAQKFLDNGLSRAYMEGRTQKAENSRVLTAVGHCHIDTAWLWPYAETRRKIARSWSSQLDLMDRYPEYTFACSQAVQFQWLKEDYPELFARVKNAVKAGRFMPIGGSWVESDMNLPSGESICRQFLYGQKFFEEEFGMLCKTFWLPDTFGYSAQLPQICRLAGMERFVTQKLSWNNINSFPHTTFNWVALDGSQVLCHMPPGDTYNSNCQVSELMRSVSNNKTRGISEKALLLFGFGDGGGGPTQEMLERLRRSASAADKVGELPSIQTGNVDTFFDSVLGDTENGTKLPTWRGELYFEFHRGTYTSQAKTKLNNRKCEILLREIELAAALTGNHSHKSDIDALWKDVLLNQFHDVLPGSSIEMVYEDVAGIYQRVFEKGTILLQSMLGSDKAIDTGNFDLQADMLSGQYSFLNTVLGSERRELVQSQDGKWVLVGFASNSLRCSRVVQAESSGVRISKTPETVCLENDFVKLTLNLKGEMKSVEYLDGSANSYLHCGPIRYVLYEDHPLNWQAWDTEVYHWNKPQYLGEESIIGFEYIEGENAVQHITLSHKISNKSTIKTVISLGAQRRTLDFETFVDWHEDCRFLKVEISTPLVSENASYDTMFGRVSRPTHYNTSWDVAKFEVNCHKYADLSEYDRGLSVLNDSKYGFSVHGSTMTLSLLRSPKAPDANADMGKHQIKWSVFGHKSALSPETSILAQQLNHPLLLATATTAEKMETTWSKLKIQQNNANLVLDTLKPSEDGKGLVLRVYDCLGAQSVLSNRGSYKWHKTDILEKAKEPLEESATLRAFEVGSYYIQY